MPKAKGQNAVKEKLREFHRRVIMNDPFNKPAMIAVMDAAARIAPNRSRNEDANRRRDRETVAREDFPAPVPHAPGLTDGSLNREKILMGTAIFDGGDTVTPRDFELINDAGFDFLITCGGKARELALETCGAYGIAVISVGEGLPLSEGIRAAAENGTLDFSQYRDHPVQAGDMGWDEPNAADFPLIGAYVRAYREALPNKFLFNNLLPDGSMKSQLGADSYREYVDRWAECVDADYISLDHYPFYCSALFNRIGFRIALNTYDCVASACRRTGRDFWIYTQTQGDWFAHMYLRVTFEQIKWQVYTALCYGARSIIQVAYRPAWGNDAYGMTDKEGRLTEQYLYARRINAEVQKLSPVLSRYRSLGVRFADAARENSVLAPAVKQQNKSSDAQGFFGIPEVKRVFAQSTALAGFFENAEGGKALMLVNCRDLFDASAAQEITMELGGEHRVRVYRKGEQVSDGRRERIRVRIGSCDGVFITIDADEGE
ncbi:MAG: hypothetical protein IJK23_14930 [Clostridia bacterium]|nr:hypothetical protein [Clostridia bacterium]